MERGKAVPLDLPVESVAGLQGQAYLDENRNGQRDEDEPLLPYARVLLRGPEARTALADGRGNFTVGGLLPGRYTLSLDPKSMDRFQEPGEPVVLDLVPGPLPQVYLAARPVVREVVKTLTEESLSVVFEPLPSVLPPGAELPLRVKVQGKPERVVAEFGGKTYPLELLEEGLYGAYLPVEGKGGVEIRVKAFRGKKWPRPRPSFPSAPAPWPPLARPRPFWTPGRRCALRPASCAAPAGWRCASGPWSFRWRGRTTSPTGEAFWPPELRAFTSLSFTWTGP